MDNEGEWEFRFHYFERVVPQMKAHKVIIERNSVGINSYGNSISSTPPTRQKSQRLEEESTASIRQNITIQHRQNSFEGIQKVYRRLPGTFHLRGIYDGLLIKEKEQEPSLNKHFL